MRTKVRKASPPSEEGLTAKVRRLPPVHPGEVLREDLMTPLGLSINGLARDLRVPVTSMSEIVDTRLPN
jgi:plasmid maintenance system antidote protein VapI